MALEAVDDRRFSISAYSMWKIAQNTNRMRYMFPSVVLQTAHAGYWVNTQDFIKFCYMTQDTKNPDYIRLTGIVDEIL